MVKPNWSKMKNVKYIIMLMVNIKYYILMYKRHILKSLNIGTDCCIDNFIRTAVFIAFEG